MSVADVKHLARGGQYTRVRISLGGLASAPRGRLLRRRPSLASMSPSGPGLGVESSPGRDAMRVTVSDVVSPSYFPLTAAVELGFFKAEGLDTEFIFPPVDSGRVLVDGDVDFYGASPYVAFQCLPEWRGGKILCALSQYTYWFLAVRADLGAVKGDLSALKGLRISASRQPGILLRK